MCGCAERVAHDEEGDVFGRGVVQDVVAVRFDHFAVRDRDGAAIVGFLLEVLSERCAVGNGGEGSAYEYGLVDEEDCGVGF